MEKELSKRFDLLVNPFTSKDAIDRLILWNNCTLKENEFIVRPHQFYVFSQDKKSEKKIAWVDMDNSFEWKQLFEKTGWDEFYLWTTGSMSLNDTKDMRAGVDLIVTWDEGCSLPSLPVMFPLLKKIQKEIEKLAENFIDRSDLNVYFLFESFSSYAFKRVLKPKLIKKDF